MSYDQETFRRIAALRLEEAKLLWRNKQPSGAYYLAGYAIECAMKARIAGQFRANEIPDRGLINRIYTHNLAELLDLAGLKSTFDAAIRADVLLGERWAIVRDWSEQACYEVWTDSDASAMIDAVLEAETIRAYFNG